ncbi:unnamed protein product, partial [Staurois parvus]
MAQALRGTTGSYTPGMPSGHGVVSAHHSGGGRSETRGGRVHTAGTVQDTKWSVHHWGTVLNTAWSVHTAGTVQDTGVVGAHSRHSSGHRWSVDTTGNRQFRTRFFVVGLHTAGTVQNTGGGRCTQQAQFRT